MYVSEITQFLNELKREKPKLEEEQRKGRAIWWDKPVDLETQRRYRESRVPQQSYVYFSNNK